MSNIVHQAYWVLKQIHSLHTPASFFINFRCVHNAKPYKDSETGKKIATSSVTHDEFVQVGDIKKRWSDGLLSKLMQLNNADAPSNVYFAINPLKEKGHKKDYFAHFNSFYLDLDSNKGYTKQQRWMQIYYWIMFGFAPSFVIDSGNGYHVYWLLKQKLERSIGETLLKKMVSLSGCNEGGNTYDISRVYRLPGFRNVKEWFDGNTPACGIVYPEKYWEIEDAPRYDAETFNGFPPSELKDLQSYYELACKNATSPEEFQIHIVKILQDAAQAHKEVSMKQAATTVATQNYAGAAKKNPWEPTLSVVPIYNEVKWPKGHIWIKKFVVGGYDAMEQGELDALKIKNGFTDTSCSQLDFMVIHALVKNGYTKEAIREFWLRPGHKLHRPDKEAKNENYFDATYDKAFGYVKAGHEGKQNTADAASDVWDDHYQTFYRDRGGNVEVILSCQLVLNGVFVDEDATTPADREWYDITAKCTDPLNPQGVTAHNMFIPNTAFSELKKIKDYFSHGTLRVMTNSNATLQRLARYLLTRYMNAPRHSFHSQVMYTNEHKFVFPNFEITEAGPIKRDENPMAKVLTQKFPMFGKFAVQFLPHEMILAQLKQFWGMTLTCHLPQMVCAVIGSIAASALKPMFEEQLAVSFHLPTVNIRGNASSAKSETLKHLSTITGVKFDASVMNLGSSQFALTRYLSSTNFLPIMIDEFKDDGSREVQPMLANVRRLVRSAYSGETLLRGRADLSVVHMKIHAAMIICGETPLERIGDISEVTRVYPVQTDMYQPERNQTVWKQLCNQHWYELCPLFYEYVLKQNAQKLYTEFLNLRDTVTNTISDYFGGERLRIGHNIAALWFGCRLYDGFIQSLDSTLPTIESVCRPQESLVRAFCETAREQGQSMVYTTKTAPTAPQQTVVVTNNEIIALLKTFGSMVEVGDRSIKERIKESTFIYKENKQNNTLAISLETMVSAVMEHAVRLDRARPPSIQKLRSLLSAALEKQEPWLTSISALIRDGRMRARCLVFDLHAVRAMGIWPPEDVLNTTPETQEMENQENGGSLLT
jgi:hypothetical protein